MQEMLVPQNKKQAEESFGTEMTSGVELQITSLGWNKRRKTHVTKQSNCYYQIKRLVVIK